MVRIPLKRQLWVKVGEDIFILAQEVTNAHDKINVETWVLALDDFVQYAVNSRTLDAIHKELSFFRIFVTGTPSSMSIAK
jgi:hypothetical protein